MLIPICALFVQLNVSYDSSLSKDKPVKLYTFTGLPLLPGC